MDVDAVGRRRERLRRRRDAAHRRGGHSFRRLRLLAAAAFAVGAGDRGVGAADRGAGAGARRRRPDERAVRRQGRPRSIILEVNPRASRTVPFVAKATGVPIAKIAARVMAGEPLRSFGLASRPAARTTSSVKEAVFPFARFPGRRHHPRAGDEIDRRGDGHRCRFPPRLRQVAAGRRHPSADRKAPCSFRSRTRTRKRRRELARGSSTWASICSPPTARRVIWPGAVWRCGGSTRFCRDGRTAKMRSSIGEVQLVINTTEGAQAIRDSFSIRRSALISNVPHYTTIAGAEAAVGAIEALCAGDSS